MAKRRDDATVVQSAPATRIHQTPQTHRRYSTSPTDVWCREPVAVPPSAIGQPQHAQHSTPVAAPSEFGCLSSMPAACCHGLVHFNHYGGAAAEVATALVNAARSAEPETASAAFTAVLTRLGTAYRPLPLTDDHASDLLGWLARVGQVYGEPDQTAQIEIVNDLLRQASGVPCISTHDDRPPHLHYYDEDQDLVDQLRAQTAFGLAHVICDAGGDRLGRCARTDCGIVYVDTSRNGRRRFCSNTCANRVRVATHRALRG